MKTLSAALSSHISSEITSLATCWKLTRRDGVILGFTDLDADITLDSVTYSAATGFTPTAIEASSQLNVDNLDIEGMLADATITEADIMAGLYDFAEIEIFMVNYTDLTQGTLKLRRGWLGEVSMHSGQFLAEVRGLTQRLSQHIGELFSASCRATLGDSRCGVTLSNYTVTGSVTSVTNAQQLVDSSRSESSALFTFGNITFSSGLNNGLSMEIKEHYFTAGIGATFILALPMPFTIVVGDSYSMTQGCDKTLTTCRDRYSNAINFRGEPHVPGLDEMLKTAGTR